MSKSKPAWEGAFVIDTEGATGYTNGFSPPKDEEREVGKKERNKKKTKENGACPEGTQRTIQEELETLNRYYCNTRKRRKRRQRNSGSM